MQAYCAKCHTKRNIMDAKSVLTRNNKQAIRGICSECGIKMFRMVKS